jgi:hypothetical protein
LGYWTSAMSFGGAEGEMSNPPNEKPAMVHCDVWDEDVASKERNSW